MNFTAVVTMFLTVSVLSTQGMPVDKQFENFYKFTWPKTWPSTDPTNRGG
jgi:hypothetical protein